MRALDRAHVAKPGGAFPHDDDVVLAERGGPVHSVKDRRLRRVPREVPLITQYASPSLISAISYGGRSRMDDPRWPESGAPDLDAYANWSVRWCGMACLRMVLLARDGQAPTLYDLTMGGLNYGAYSNEPGKPQGLIYGPFAAYARAVHSLEAEVVPHLDPARLVSEVGRGHMVIASVHPEIRRSHRPSPGKGGHLVLVMDYLPGRRTIGYLDPAGHTASTARASLALPVFETFFANRGVVLRGV